MLYRLLQVFVVGLLMLTGCQPGPASPTAVQAGTDRTSTTGIPSNQIQIQAQTSSVLTLAKSANPQIYSQVGQTITYTFVITIVGTTPLGPAQFMITDSKLGAPFACGQPNTTLAPNQPVNCTASYVITQTDMNITSLTNTATVSGAGQTSAPASTTITQGLIPTATGTRSPNPFDGFPPEYQGIQLPEQIIEIINRGGFVVPLPTNPGSLAEELTQVASNFELSRFDLSRIVHFQSQLGREYIAVPVSADYFKSHFGVNEDFTKGVLVGLIYDKNGGYRGVRDVYEVWAYENYSSLNGLWYKNAVPLTLAGNQFYWRAQNDFSNLPLAFFIKNGCWLCWDTDSRCGCLVCID